VATGYVVRALRMSATGTVLATTTSSVPPGSAVELAGGVTGTPTGQLRPAGGQPGGHLARAQIMVLGAMFFALALALDAGYAVAGGAVRRWLGRRGAGHRYGYAIAGSYLTLAAYTVAV
jgi:hypothetical protein